MSERHQDPWEADFAAWWEGRQRKLEELDVPSPRIDIRTVRAAWRDAWRLYVAGGGARDGGEN